MELGFRTHRHELIARAEERRAAGNRCSSCLFCSHAVALQARNIPRSALTYASFAPAAHVDAPPKIRALPETARIRRVFRLRRVLPKPYSHYGFTGVRSMAFLSPTVVIPLFLVFIKIFDPMINHLINPPKSVGYPVHSETGNATLSMGE